MATSFIDFTPSNNAAFQFQVTLDGAQYNVVVTYNLFGQRYYVNIYTTQGTLILCRPMIGSPPGYDISITGNMFTSTLVYRIGNKQFEVSDTPNVYPTFGQIPQYLLGSDFKAFVLDQSMLG